MRDEGETKLTPQEQSLNEEIEKLQDQWPYLMNEIFFIDYLKNPTYERGLAAKSKILACGRKVPLERIHIAAQRAKY